MKALKDYYFRRDDLGAGEIETWHGRMLAFNVAQLASTWPLSLPEVIPEHRISPEHGRAWRPNKM